MSTGTKFLGDSDIQRQSPALVILPYVAPQPHLPRPPYTENSKSSDHKPRALFIKHLSDFCADAQPI